MGIAITASFADVVDQELDNGLAILSMLGEEIPAAFLGIQIAVEHCQEFVRLDFLADALVENLAGFHGLDGVSKVVQVGKLIGG
jgi:hypothetical protein